MIKPKIKIGDQGYIDTYHDKLVLYEVQDISATSALSSEDRLYVTPVNDKDYAPAYCYATSFFPNKEDFIAYSLDNLAKSLIIASSKTKEAEKSLQSAQRNEDSVIAKINIWRGFQ